MIHGMEREQMRQLDKKIMAERSSLTEWIEGKASYPSDLVSIEIPFTEVTNPALRTIRNDVRWRLASLPSKEVDALVCFAPQHDDLYDWVEVDLVLGKNRITGLSYLLERDQRIDGFTKPWEGNSRQRLKDFLSGKVDKTKLVPINTQIVTTNISGINTLSINLMYIGRAMTQLLLTDVSTDLKLTECIVRPYVNDDGETMIDCIDKAGNVFSRFIYQEESDWFAPEGFYRGMVEKRKQRNQKRLEIEEAVREFTRNGGIISVSQLKKAGLMQLADDIYSYFPGGMKALRAQLGYQKERKKEIRQPNAQKANDYLRNLVFGEEDV